MNIDLLKKMLTSGCEYWLVAKSMAHRSDPSVWIISLPYKYNIDQQPDAILLKDVEALSREYIDANISLSQSYPPFQVGQQISEFVEGFPITHNVKEFVIKALNAPSGCIWDYKALLDKHLAAKPETV